jgi:heat-inducible transcriptional repressor
MDERKKLILNTIIKEHIKTGAPVGSGILVEKYKLNMSPATVRNEMSFLEEEGYIIQPHTSAGRIPTELAYNFYLENIKPIKTKKQESDHLTEILKIKEEKNLKEVARFVSRISGSAVFWAFHRHNLFYTGISNLFQQPEFAQMELIYNISSVIDGLDDIIDNIYEEVQEGLNTFVGSNNPFGAFAGTVLAKYRLNDKMGIFGILGPIRMDYEKNIALVNFIFQELNN